MRSSYFTPEHDAFRRTVRRFLEEEVAPHAEEWERERRIPRSIFRRMGDLGFLGILHPERYGGAEADIFYAVALLEELPRSLMGGFCAAVSVQQFMAVAHIAKRGSEALKERYLRPSIAGAKVGALAITEPDAGSDVASLRAKAVREGDTYVVSGAKTFITNGAEADFFTLAVRTGRQEEGAAGISLLVVDSASPGVTVARRLDKMGWHASDTAELAFQEVRVPAGNLVGEEGSGFAQIVEAFALERICGAASAVGGADLALEVTKRYLRQRTAFGRPLRKFQALRHRLADLATEVEAARQLTHYAAWLLGRGEQAIREAAMAKLFATEVGKKVADECLQMHGGYGYMEEYPLARLYRDARAGTIAAGTSEIMREIISRFLLDSAEEETPPSQPPRKETPMATVPPPAAETPKDVEGLIRSLPSRMRPGAAEGWKSVFHYTIRDAAKPQWTVRIDGESCTVTEGHEGSPNCRVEMMEATYLGIETGTANPQAAFMMGKVKISDLGEMMRFIKVFRPAVEKK
jgi:acyl-CoA dehydrogenase